MLTKPDQVSIRGAARDLLQKLYDSRTGMDRKGPPLEEVFPVDLHGIVRAILNWDVEYVDGVGYTPDHKPRIGCCNHTERKISIDAKTHPQVQRYTLAHEIGHAMLHPIAPICGAPISDAPVVQLRSREPEVWKTEREAEVFAKELLMPEKAVRRQFRIVVGCDRIHAASSKWRQIVGHPIAPNEGISAKAERLARFQPEVSSGDTRLKSLVDCFGVSARSMAIRMLELGLVT